MKFTLQQQTFMQRAIELAWKGFGKTQPNPLVGAVVVKNGKIVGEGYHQKLGGAHAEVNALKMAGTKARGADLYVTLDPCCHTGRTGPCTEVVKKYGIRNVFSAMSDPHDPRHEGEKILKRAGIQFQRGLLADVSREALQFYLKNVEKSLSYVILKVATTMDGKVATASGFSRGITSQDSLKFTHTLRSQADGVLTGGGTLAMDNPHMGVRYAKGKDPVRILLDSDLDVTMSSDFFRDNHVIVFTTKKASSGKIRELKKRGIEVVILDSLSDLSVILRMLFERKIYILMIEAGHHMMTSFIQGGFVDQYIQLIAPKLLGGSNSPTSFEGPDSTDYSKMKIVKDLSVSQLGPDILLKGYLSWY